MSTHRLNSAKLLADLNTARRAGKPGEVSYRAIGAQAGVGSSVFTRLQAGDRPSVDTFLSLLMWLDPEAKLADYVLAGEPAKRRTVS